jgi:chorismate mutase
MRDAGRNLEERAQNIRSGRADKLHNSNILDEAFGMGAIARDLKLLLHLREELVKKIAQLRRDNGKPVRRRGMVNIVESSSVNTVTGTNGQYTRPSFTSQHYQSGWNAQQTTHIQESTTYWFSARFKYYIPDLPDGNPDWRHSVVRRLLGLGTHPASLAKLAFNLGPWLWLISWATTMADILSNVESAAVDNLTNDYAFIMGSFERKTKVESSVFFRTDQPRWFSAEKIETIKARSRANPYGFSLTDGFTDRQKYILGTLAAQKGIK